MALSESVTFGTSPIKFGSTNVALMWGTGDPDGDSSPFSDAVKGTRYFRTDASDDVSPLWLKVDLDSTDDDWVQVVIDKDSTAYTIKGHWTWDADKRVYFRDTGIYVFSPSDGVLRLVADTAVRLGDGTNQACFADDGELTLTGTAKVTRAIPLDLVLGGGTATIEAFKGAPSINLDADTETWYFSFEAPNDWDAASDMTLVFMVANEIAETDGDDVSFTLQVRGYADGETMGDAGQAVAVLQDLTGGDEAIDVVNRCTGTIDYDHGTYPIAAGDTVVVECTVNLADGVECTGPLHIIAQWVEYTANKLGTAT